MKKEDIRNIAIIAHVDHGKTTLVDKLLQQSGTFRENEAYYTKEQWTPTILRENAGLPFWQKIQLFSTKITLINIVDTPGHADFGGEVERIMKMVDGVLLVVDAFEGTCRKPAFVLKKALEQKSNTHSCHQQDRPRQRPTR